MQKEKVSGQTFLCSPRSQVDYRHQPRGDSDVTTKAPWPTAAKLKEAIQAARGEKKADLVIKKARLLDVFTGDWIEGDLAIFGEMIVGVQETYSGVRELDGTGLFAVPGFIDAHVHIESSLLTPRRFAE